MLMMMIVVVVMVFVVVVIIKYILRKAKNYLSYLISIKQQHLHTNVIYPAAFLKCVVIKK